MEEFSRVRSISDTVVELEPPILARTQISHLKKFLACLRGPCNGRGPGIFPSISLFLRLFPIEPNSSFIFWRISPFSEQTRQGGTGPLMSQPRDVAVPEHTRGVVWIHPQSVRAPPPYPPLPDKPSTVLGNKFFDCRAAVYGEISHKADRYESKILVISKFRVFLISGRTPSTLKVERSFHLLNIRGISATEEVRQLPSPA